MDIIGMMQSLTTIYLFLLIVGGVFAYIHGEEWGTITYFFLFFITFIPVIGDWVYLAGLLFCLVLGDDKVRIGALMSLGFHLLFALVVWSVFV